MPSKVSAAQYTFLIFISLGITVAVLDTFGNAFGVAAGGLSVGISNFIIVALTGLAFVYGVWVIDPTSRWFERFHRHVTIEEAKDRLARGKMSQQRFDQLLRQRQLDDEIARQKEALR